MNIYLWAPCPPIASRELDVMPSQNMQLLTNEAGIPEMVLVAKRGEESSSQLHSCPWSKINIYRFWIEEVN